MAALGMMLRRRQADVAMQQRQVDLQRQQLAAQGPVPVAAPAQQQLMATQAAQQQAAMQQRTVMPGALVHPVVTPQQQAYQQAQAQQQQQISQYGGLHAQPPGGAMHPLQSVAATPVHPVPHPGVVNGIGYGQGMGRASGIGQAVRRRRPWRAF